MADQRYVKGVPELKTFMANFPERMADITRGGLEAGMNVVKPVAQSNIHSVSGALANGLKVGTRQTGNTVIAYLRATGPEAFKAKFVEFGTNAHKIASKVAAALSFNGRFVKSVAHPGAKPHPFLRPALDSQAGPAVAAAAEYMKKRLASEQRFDAADVQAGKE